MLMWTCVALAAAPWLVVLRARIGGLASLALVTLAAPALLLLLMVAARAASAPLLETLVGALALAGIAGLALGLRSGVSWRSRGASKVTDVLPAALGGTVALGTFMAARLLPGSPRVSWAMLGDSASQLVNARQVLSAGGLTPPPMANPVPLPSAIIAAVSAPGRPTTGEGAILSHDLAALATTWAALIVITCLLAGAVGYAVVHHSRGLSPRLGRATVAATSLLPLGWFWTGYPVKFGFINAHVIFVVLLASILAYFGTLRRPVMGLAMQALAIVLTVLTWSPLAVIPAALALVLAAGALRSLARKSRGVRVASLVVAVAGLGGVAALGIPMLAEARGALSVGGGLAEFPKLMLPAAAIMLVSLTFAASRRADSGRSGLISIGVASLVGLGAIVVLSGTVSGPWSYYPHKYAWIATAILVIVALPQATSAVARVPAARLRVGLYGAGTLALAASLGLGSWWAPGNLHFLRGSVPYLILVEDDLPDEGQSPDAVADAVVARVGLSRLTIPWESRLANDYRAAFWLIQLRREEALRTGDGSSSAGLWTLANFHESPADLCTLAGLVPEGLTVETSNATLASQVAEQCPWADLRIERDAPTS